LVDDHDFTSDFSIKGKALEGRAAYLDFQATTPMDPRVLDCMMPYMTEQYGNPHSRTHEYGWETETAVEVRGEEREERGRETLALLLLLLLVSPLSH
jgi:cysteine desulfurase